MLWMMKVRGLVLMHVVNLLLVVYCFSSWRTLLVLVLAVLGRHILQEDPLLYHQMD